MNLLEFFTDPILRAPTWGTLFMCIASSLMGVFVLLKKRSLLTETLSHATYPGIILFVSLFALFLPQHEEWMFLPVFVGAFLSSFFALKAIEWLEEKVPSDAALCFILALFFGAGVVLASGMQANFPKWYQAAQMLLFGQAATMTDIHIVLYGLLAFLTSLFLYASFRPLQALLFDRSFAASLGIRIRFFERIVFLFLLFSLIIGMRSVGVILMSGMAIAPAVAARQFSDRLQTVFWLAALFGAFSGLLGNILSVKLSVAKFSLPTGPMIVLVGTMLALFALAFAPKRGLFFRLFRIVRFRIRCIEENILKGIWKKGPRSFQELRNTHRMFLLPYLLFRMQREGWLKKTDGIFALTHDGQQKAAAIVRLHRLWELYLTEQLGQEVEKVHRNAEEMEHILTPELEEKLTRILSNPQKDPHQQPIPER